MFKSIDPHPHFPEIEEKILAYWKKNNIFEKSLKKKSVKGKWTFLDGPPFITGLPHYGSLLSSIPKDVFPRYYTMNGYKVERVWGWDCHGLPAENKVENTLHITRKKDIEEKIGVEKFIRECKKYVGQVSSEWEWYIDHIARWVDFKNAYKTMDLSYMETVMWVFHTLYKKRLIYKGLRVSLYCPHCATPISHFEVAMDADNYKDVSEPSNVYKFQLVDRDFIGVNKRNTFFLAWSTTPWNKIVTMALAINPDITYVKVLQGDEQYILAEKSLEILKKEPYKIIQKYKGKNLIGIRFIPSFDYHSIESNKKAYRIVADEFVTADEGTGIVTLAAYGEEDLMVMQKNNIQIVTHLDENGVIITEGLFKGMYYLDANKEVNLDLKKRGLMYKEEMYTHSIPTCWRCHTRLYYAPQNAWYVDIQKLKPDLKKANEYIQWYPSHFKYGRFLKSMEMAPDWCISRSRYWGSPVPVWECECGERFVPSSIQELEKKSGEKIQDLHKPDIDTITIVCKACGKKSKRVNEVLDSWIEAGSAALAEHHYPFENANTLKSFFPPDFITEYTGQIRAWFYVLHVLAVGLDLLDDKKKNIVAKHVLVTGVILGTDGRKMSKNYGNYPDPKELLQKYGGDALRLYLLGSPVMKGEDIRISEVSYREQNRFLLVLWNVYNFFITYALIDGWKPICLGLVTASPRRKEEVINSSHVLDQWILSRFNGYLKNLVEKSYSCYDTMEAVGLAHIFIKDLSTWYVRNIRSRVGPTATDVEDKNNAYQTLWFVLKEYVRSLAPIIPFISEEIYQNLTGEDSVHLTDWTKVDHSLIDYFLEKQMQSARELSSSIHQIRKVVAKVKVQIPLRKLNYTGSEELTDEIKKIVLDETNVYELMYQGKGKMTEYAVSGQFGKENQDLEMGRVREIIRSVQKQRKKQGLMANEYITALLPDYPRAHEAYIKTKIMAKSIAKGKELTIEKINET